jgi:hypothetical protein
MPAKSKLIVIGLLTALFVAGIIHLFLLRFEAGDVYPPYSSLRSDPLGTKVLYNSLERFGRLQVRRNYAKLSALSGARQSTLFLLGLDAERLAYAPDAFYRQMERWIAEGGRLVLSLRSVREKRSQNQDSSSRSGHARTSPRHDADQGADSNSRQAKNDKRQAPETDTEPESPDSQTSPAADTAARQLEEHWGLVLGGMEGEPNYAHGMPAEPLPDRPFKAVNWYNRLYIESMPDNWKPVLAVSGRPVMIERRFKKGSILISTDSYFFSNEGLRVERQPQLLTWLIGGRSRIIFDERHLGVGHSPGLAHLMRRYRFQWFIASAICLTALFVWKNAHPFIPPPKAMRHRTADHASAKDSLHGLTGLLRRNVPLNRILTVCIAEWRSARQRNRAIRQSRRTAEDALIRKWENDHGTEGDPVAGYRAISRILTEGKRSNGSKHRRS